MMQEDCITVFLEKLFSINAKRLFVGAYIETMRRLYTLSNLPPSVLSKNCNPYQVKMGMDRLWHLFFDQVNIEVVQTELKKMEDGIIYLHEKINEENWIVDVTDYLYMQYVTPFHIAAWIGYYDFFTLIKTKFPFVWNSYIASIDLLGNHPLHVVYFSCDSWSQDINTTWSLEELFSADYSTVNALGLNPLHIACICGQQRGVKQLVSQSVVLDTPVRLPISDDLNSVLDAIEQIRDVCCLPSVLRPCWKRKCDKGYFECGSLDSNPCSYGTFSDESYDDHGRLASISQESTKYMLDGLTALHLCMKMDAPMCALLVMQSVNDLLTTSFHSSSALQLSSLLSMSLFSYLSTHTLKQFQERVPKLMMYVGSSGNPCEDLIPLTLINGILTYNYPSVFRILSSQINLKSSCFNRAFSPLHIACVMLNETFIRVLIGYGADCRQLTDRHQSCLHLVMNSQARSRGGLLKSTLCGLLIMAGCDLMVRDEKGYSVLWYAVIQHDLSTISLLISYCPSLLTLTQGSIDRTVLQLSLLLQQEDTVRLLLRVNSSTINQCDGQGWFPPHYAMQNHNYRLFVILLNSGIHLSDGCLKDLGICVSSQLREGGKLTRFVATQVNDQMIINHKTHISTNPYQLMFYLNNNTVTHCMNCTREFTLLMRRRHCRECGQILCFNCCKIDHDKLKDHHCEKCIAYHKHQSVDDRFVQGFLDSIKSYFVTSASPFLRKKE